AMWMLGGGGERPEGDGGAAGGDGGPDGANEVAGGNGANEAAGGDIGPVAKQEEVPAEQARNEEVDETIVGEAHGEIEANVAGSKGANVESVHLKVSRSPDFEQEVQMVHFPENVCAPRRV
ncbi:hypothetical protein PIB30_080846, partial [Stylosanthes scabra]|nr:hypothetical protein [Stylosanthes scabra]